MARPDFNTSIGDLVYFSTESSPPSSTFVEDARYSSEVSLPKVTRERKPKGWLPPKSYSMTYRTYTRAFGVCTLTRPPLATVRKYTGCVGGSGRFNSLNHFDQLLTENLISDSSLKNSALIAARLKLKQGKVNLGVAFAERNQTARLLGDMATSFAKSFTQLRRGNIRNAMNELGISSKKREPRGSNVPSKWLELQYGWKPFASDVFGSCEALEQEPNENWRVTAKATKMSRVIQLAHFPNTESGDGVVDSRRSNFTRLDALPGNPLLGSLSSLGITNPLLIAWESVPYSFVVDWAFPIGNWLDSLDALLGYESAYYSSSDYTRCDWKGVGTSEVIAGSPPQLIVNDYVESKRMVVLTRDVSDNVPLPSFPSIKDPRSLGHMANGLALLASSFGRR